MNEYVVAAPAQIAVPVTGGGLFPVRRVFCVGRNYAAHAREMGSDPDREPPFFFCKPADAIVTGGEADYPPATASLHHEIELVVAIGQSGANVPAANALAMVFGYAVGIDLTRRDLQEAAKTTRRPWDMSKGFDQSGPIGEIVPVSVAGHPAAGRISITVNGELRQQGDLADQIWPVPEIIAALSQLVRLQPGDLIFTGTPDGVGPLNKGDLAEGQIEGVGHVKVRIV